MKPTLAEFKAHVLARWPGATVIDSGGGLYVVVGSPDVAMLIQMEAKEAGLARARIHDRGPEDYLVSIFGFRKGLPRG